MNRKLFFALFAISIGINIKYFTNKFIYRTEGPKIDSWNMGRVSVQSNLPIDTSDVVFVGTSLTAGFPTEEMFHSLHIKNRGIIGNNSTEILARIGNIASGKPKKIFLELGINDIYQDFKDDEIIRNYGMIVDSIRSKSSHTMLFAESVFPTGMSEANLNKRVLTLNEKIRSLSKKLNISYVNIHPLLLKNNTLDSAYTFDGVHLTWKGYAIWKSKITPLL